jgi:hypothetical protein
LIAKQVTAILLTIYSVIFGVEAVATAPTAPKVEIQQTPQPLLDLVTKASTPKSPYEGVEWRHGDVSWLPRLALMAGWEEKQIPRLTRIILRESGGCPHRRGGDIVDKNCNVVGHDGSNHASDTGLLQINGVNYNPKRNKWAAICREMNICEQEPLLDALTNLKAGRVLFEISGWDPWNPCTWDASRCGKGN